MKNIFKISITFQIFIWTKNTKNILNIFRAKNSKLTFAKTLSFTMGDVSAGKISHFRQNMFQNNICINTFSSDVFTADVALTLTKAKNKPASTLKTAIDSITVTGTVTRKCISMVTA